MLDAKFLLKSSKYSTLFCVVLPFARERRSALGSSDLLVQLLQPVELVDPLLDGRAAHCLRVYSPT